MCAGFMKTLSSVLLFLWFSSFSLAAETLAKSGIECSCLALQELQVKEEIFYRDGNALHPLPYKVKGRGKAFFLRKGMKEIALYIKVPDREEPRLIARAALLTGVNKQMFVIANASKEAEFPLQIKVLDDSLNGFPLSSVRYVNLSGSLVYVSIDGKPTRLEKNAFTTIPLQGKPEGGYIGVAYGDAQKNKISFKRLYNHPRSRKIILITQSQNEKRKLDFTYVPQNVPAEM